MGDEKGSNRLYRMKMDQVAGAYSFAKDSERGTYEVLDHSENQSEIAKLPQPPAIHSPLTSLPTCAYSNCSAYRPPNTPLGSSVILFPYRTLQKKKIDISH